MTVALEQALYLLGGGLLLAGIMIFLSIWWLLPAMERLDHELDRDDE